jgi:hypothetical protein
VNRDASPTTHAPSFKKKLLIHLFLFLSLLSARLPPPCAHRWPWQTLNAATSEARQSVARRDARLPSPSRGVAASHRSCGRCLPSTTCSHWRRPATYKRRRAAISSEHHSPRSLHFAEKQEDVALKAHVARVCSNCFRCFRDILQVFHMDVAKIDRCCTCCKRPFQKFHLLFQTYVASVFIWMLHMFHTYVASFILMFNMFCTDFFKCFNVFFTSVSEAYCKCFI